MMKRISSPFTFSLEDFSCSEDKSVDVASGIQALPGVAVRPNLQIFTEIRTCSVGTQGGASLAVASASS